jgi:Coenzyme PQQ synthesis protein D (PqqD)
MGEQNLQHFSPLSLDTVVTRRTGFIDAEIESEIVALNIENGTCYGLNRVGSRIWNFLAEPIRIRDICAKLVTEYKVEPAVCERQVLDLLEELHSQGLISAPEEK